jgi:hypothetical protein
MLQFMPVRSNNEVEKQGKKGIRVLSFKKREESMPRELRKDITEMTVTQSFIQKGCRGVVATTKIGELKAHNNHVRASPKVTHSIIVLSLMMVQVILTYSCYRCHAAIITRGDPQVSAFLAPAGDRPTLQKTQFSVPSQEAKLQPRSLRHFRRTQTLTFAITRTTDDARTAQSRTQPQEDIKQDQGAPLPSSQDQTHLNNDNAQDSRSSIEPKDAIGQTPDNTSSRTSNQYQSTPKSKAFYSSDQIQQIKQHVNIVEVIEDYANLSQFTKTSSYMGEESAKCICPFHDDTHPSLSIDNSPSRKIYKCFSCGAGGDVLHFLCNYDDADASGAPMTFGEATQYLVDNYCAPDFLEELGIPAGSVNVNGRRTPRSNSNRPRTQRQHNSTALIVDEKERQALLAMHASAAQFYFQNLVASPNSAVARGYLMERGLSAMTVRKFCLGFAVDAYFGPTRQRNKGQKQSEFNAVPDGSLVQHLQRDGYTPQQLVDSGLVSVKKKKREELIQLQTTSNLLAEPVGEKAQDPVVTAASFAFEYEDLMDRFMNRLMVPIWDAEGMHVIGFGGRIIDVPVNVNTAAAAATNFTAPKYINSPESAIFHKKENLFGLHEAAKALSQKHALSNNNTVMLVEGYMDSLSLSNVGIDNVAATMGTALSGQQLQVAGAAATSNQTRAGKFIHALAVHTGDRVRRKVSLLADQNLILSRFCLFPIHLKVKSFY